MGQASINRLSTPFSSKTIATNRFVNDNVGSPGKLAKICTPCGGGRGGRGSLGTWRSGSFQRR